MKKQKYTKTNPFVRWPVAKNVLVATKGNKWNRISGQINNAGFHGRAGDSICSVAAGEGAAKLVATCNGTKGEQEASKTTSSDEPQNSTRRKNTPP
jgi:hypothetical protein